MELVGEALWLGLQPVPFVPAWTLEEGVMVGEVELLVVLLVVLLVELLVVILVGPWTAGASAWLR